MKTVLALETSGPFLSVALGTKQGKVAELRSRRALQHSENLIPFVDRLLQKERIKRSEVEVLAIDRGPGSFTGLRIGFSFLKGWLAARKISCYGSLSLDMIAEAVRLPEGSRLGVLVDARRERIYTRFYLRRDGSWRPETKPELLSLSELKSRLTEGTRLTGDALLRYRQAMSEPPGPQIFFLEERSYFPSASALVGWFQGKDSRLIPLKVPGDLVPLYFRSSEAEEKRSEHQQHAF